MLAASAVGGTTLLGAGAALAPDPRVWEDPCWPPEVVGDGWLAEGFARALTMLRPAPWPEARPLERLARLAEAAERLGAGVTRPPLALALAAGPSAAGIAMAACTGCGDCNTGCNVGARTTARETWLADAVAHGAAIFAGVEVVRVEKALQGWRVLWQTTEPAGTIAGAPAGPATGGRATAAALVVLGAGAVGTSRILLASADAGLALSPRLGQGLTTNGAAVALAWNGQKPVAGVGIGEPAKVEAAPPGPASAGRILLPGEDSLGDALSIAETTLPSGLAEALPVPLGEAARRFGQRTSSGMLDSFQEAVARDDAARLGPWAGAMQATQIFSVSGHDAAAGEIVRAGDGLGLAFPEPGPAQRAAHARLVETATANNATFLADPLAGTRLAGGRLVTEPLGGAGMGRDRTAGVIDHEGRVYDAGAAEPTATHEGLYVVDGAAVARPLGVPPMLTIMALAERAMALLALRLGRQLALATHVGPDAASAKEAAAPPARATIRERFAGWISDRAGADHAAAATVGRSFGHAIVIDLATHSAPAGGDRERGGDSAGGTAAAVAPGSASGSTAPWAHVTGLLQAPMIDPLALTFTAAVRAAADAASTVRHVGEGTLVAADGRIFGLTLARAVPTLGRAADMVADATTLACDIVERRGAGRQWRGELTIAPAAAAQALAAIETAGGADRPERLAAVAGLGARLAGPLYDVHGQVVAVPPSEGADGLAGAGGRRFRRRRGLRAGGAEMHALQAGDGTWLELTRYDRDGANRRGPVVLVPGLATSARVFALDTLDTSLVEYLADRGYDCWLLDGRATSRLAGPAAAGDLDAHARHDLPAAFDLVRRLSGAPSVQVVAHCVGALTTAMAVLGGHTASVRTAVLMHAGPDVAAAGSRQHVAATLRLATALERLGTTRIGARDRGRARNERLAGVALQLLALGLPDDGGIISRRLAALAGSLVEVDQLDPATLEAGLPSVLVETPVALLAHLARMVAAGRVVDSRGGDVYLAHIERLAFPILFIHGAQNGCFAPSCTASSFEKLVARNGARLYERHVVPNYGHLDCLVGRKAAIDVFPRLLAHLERTVRPRE